MFLNTYHISPALSSAYLSYVNLPWTPKLLYGIFTDTFPICGSGKRSYIFIMGMLQSLSCLAIAVRKYDNASTVMWFALFNSGAGAVMDVVVDGLMVINSRKDPNFGSEELQSYSWGFYGLGGIVGCTLSAILLGPLETPQACFFVMAFFGAAVGISGLFIDPSLEDNSADLVAMSLG